MRLQDIANMIEGELCGDKNIEISMLSPIESPSEGTILYVEKSKYLITALASSVAALLVPTDMNLPPTTKSIIKAKNAKLAFIKLLSHFEQKQNLSRSILQTIHPTAIIGDHVCIDESVTIMAYAVVMANVTIKADVIIYPHSTIGQDSYIGQGTVIHSHVVLEKGTILGKHNIIYAGAVIGSDGFGYYDSDEKRYKIPQLGIVETGDYVEIGANTTIDRGTIGKTLIGSHTKIDNLVQIAHNSVIGERCYIAAQTGLAGSCTLGNGVILAGQVGIADHIVLEDDVVVLGQSGVTRSVKAGEMVMGFPARPVKEARRIYALLSQLLKKK